MSIPIPAVTTDPLQIAHQLALLPSGDLRIRCRMARLPATGSKAHLIDRLASHLALTGGKLTITLHIPAPRQRPTRASSCGCGVPPQSV